MIADFPRRAIARKEGTLPQSSRATAFFAATILGMTRARLDAVMAELGKSPGPPWGKYQKEAAGLRPLEAHVADDEDRV